MENNYGWERWRGEHEARVERIEADVRTLAEWREGASDRLVRIETKVATWAALGGIVGGALIAFVEHLFR